MKNKRLLLKKDQKKYSNKFAVTENFFGYLKN